jgi:HK97 family phage major capsid protein
MHVRNRIRPFPYRRSEHRCSTSGWNEIEQIFSGSTTGFTPDKIIDMQAALKDTYQANATWLARRSTIAELRKLKSPVETQGGQNYLIVPDFANAARSTMLGSPIVADPDMPAVASSALSLAYGDFARAYTIVNRRGLDVIRNPFRTSGKVIYQSTMRNGGDVTNFEAIKIMDNATS